MKNKMDKLNFINLLNKYLKEDLSKEERQFIECYYNLFQNEPDVFDTLSLAEKKEFKNEIKGAIWNNISRDEQSNQKIHFLNERAVTTILIMLFKNKFTFLPDRQKAW